MTDLSKRLEGLVGRLRRDAEKCSTRAGSQTKQRRTQLSDELKERAADYRLAAQLIEDSQAANALQDVEGEPDPFEGMRPASAAHIKLVGAVLHCLESGIWPETVLRFVREELPGDVEGEGDNERGGKRFEVAERLREKARELAMHSAGAREAEQPDIDYADERSDEASDLRWAAYFLTQPVLKPPGEGDGGQVEGRVREAVELVTNHRIQRLEEQPGVDEAGPLIRETLRAEVEDWMPLLLAHLRPLSQPQAGEEEELTRPCPCCGGTESEPGWSVKFCDCCNQTGVIPDKRVDEGAQVKEGRVTIDLPRHFAEALLAATEIDYGYRAALSPSQLSAYMGGRDKLRAALKPESNEEER